MINNRNHQRGKHRKIRPKLKNELKVVKYVNVLVWERRLATYQSYPAITGCRVQRRKQFVARSQQQKQQWRHGSGNSSSSRDHTVLPPLRSRIATDFSVPHSAVHIDRSLSPRLTPFPPCQRRGVRGAAGISGGGRAFAWWGFACGSWLAHVGRDN